MVVTWGAGHSMNNIISIGPAIFQVAIMGVGEAVLTERIKVGASILKGAHTSN